MSLKLDREKAFQSLIAAPFAPWREVPSKSVAQILGVSTQTLANWRMRRVGPPAARPIAREGRACTYRLSEVGAWLTAQSPRPLDASEVCLMWLGARGTTTGSLEAVIQAVEGAKVVNRIERVRARLEAGQSRVLCP
jgi:hypothetical protein